MNKYEVCYSAELPPVIIEAKAVHWSNYLTFTIEGEVVALFNTVVYWRKLIDPAVIQELS